MEKIQGIDFESYDIDYLIHKIVETTRISIPKTNQKITNIGKVISTANNKVVYDVPSQNLDERIKSISSCRSKNPMSLPI